MKITQLFIPISHWLGYLSCGLAGLWLLLGFFLGGSSMNLVVLIASLPAYSAITIGIIGVYLVKKEKRKSDILIYKGIILGIIGKVILFLTLNLEHIYNYLRDTPITYTLICVVVLLVLNFLISRINKLRWF